MKITVLCVGKVKEKFYRDAIDDWWISIKYSENPLWYFIYQLAYPDKQIRDAYKNDIAETAVWSLSRHPADTVLYHASNKNRDDIAELNMSEVGIDLRERLAYNIKTSPSLPDMGENPEITDIIKKDTTVKNSTVEVTKNKVEKIIREEKV